MSVFVTLVAAVILLSFDLASFFLLPIWFSMPFSNPEFGAIMEISNMQFVQRYLLRQKFFNFEVKALGSIYIYIKRGIRAYEMFKCTVQRLKLFCNLIRTLN